jgi:hypothetical protein
MKGTPAQLTCRGALYGYPKLTLSNSPVHMGQDMSLTTTPKKKPQLIEISQGQIIRVHLPLLYPHLPHLNQDKTKNWWG